MHTGVTYAYQELESAFSRSYLRAQNPVHATLGLP
jgi:hypothetical protein